MKNFALIDDLELTFDEGFTILTGETGAGKSILIDAISFVLGEKFNKEFIRTGAKSTQVEAVFKVENEAKALLTSLGIDYEDTLIMEREGFDNGRSLARINGKTVLVGTLKDVGKEVLDIHGQHHNQNLLDSSKHKEYLDEYLNIYEEDIFKAYLVEYNHLKDLKDRLRQLEGHENRDKVMDYLKFQIEDIEKANLSVAEEESLREKGSLMSHAEKIAIGVGHAHELLGNEDEVLEKLSKAITAVKSIMKYYEKISQPLENMENAYYNLEESFRELSDLKENLYFDQDELNEINQRLFIYGTYQKKYGKEVSDVLAFYDKIKKEYEELESAEDHIQELKEKIAVSTAKGNALGETLMKKRKAGGEKLSSKINEELKFVGLKKAQFKVHVEKTDKMDNLGTDDVNYLMATNVGEPMKPLEKIVSGGELSRIMLSMKVAFMDKDKTPSVIFDEIDTGISGRVAEAVGEKMYSLSHRFQVFCVTHLPQIAAFSDTHLVVSKNEDKKRTYTRVANVNLEGSVYELAHMMGGSEISEPQIKSAEDLLKKTKEIKEKYYHIKPKSKAIKEER